MEFMLPKLKNNHTISGIGLAEFNPLAYDDISKIQNGIDVDKTLLIHPENYLSSIPDIWARPILFEMALFKTDHLLHSRTLGEWRGLLAILALKNVCNLNDLEIIGLSIENNNSNAFVNVLNNHKPKNLIYKSMNWDNIYTIKFNNMKTLGMTSPTTLVCTAADCFSRISSRIGWHDGNVLLDPIEYLSNHQKICLNVWLDDLIKTLQDPARTSDIVDPPLHNSLIQLLLDYTTDLGVTLDDTITAPSSLLEDSFAIPDLLISTITAPSDVTTSNVKLKTSAKKQPTTDLLVIIDPSQWGKNAQDIEFVNNTTLGFVLNSSIGTIKTNIGNVNLPTGYEWRKEEDFFNNDIYLVPFGAKLFPNIPSINFYNNVNNIEGNQYTPLFPFKEEILKYLDSGYLAENTTFNLISNKEVTVELKILLSGTNGNQREYKLTKRYGRENIKTTITDIPQVSIWPDFIFNDVDGANKWKIYFTYVEAKGFAAIPSNYPNINFQDVSIFKTEDFPEALFCYTDTGTKNNPVWQFVGILPIDLNKVTKPATKGDTWNIGVDFGTTGTTIYANINNSKMIPMIFKNQLFNITYNQPLLANTYDNFLPPIDRQSETFMSFYYKFPNPNFKVIKDGHIYFPEDRIDASNESVKTNLKWGTDLTQISQNFIEQLFLQICAESITQGASIIGFRYSFPTSFSSTQIGTYIEHWGNIIHNYTDKMGLTFAEPQNMNESISSARFFYSKENLNFNRGFISVDMGGGSTDISIWQDNGLMGPKLQYSLQFAARLILLNSLLKHESLSNLVFKSISKSDENLLKKTRSMGENQFYAQAEVLLNNYGKEIVNSLTSSGSEEVKDLLSRIMVAISGLFYYIGISLRSLKGNSILLPDICIGGNGSRIFAWPGYGSLANIKVIISRMIYFGYKQEMDGSKKPLNIHYSDKLKKESSIGLVSDIDGIIKTDSTTLGQLEDTAFHTDIIPGESIIGTKNKYAFDSEIKYSEYLDRKNRINGDLLQMAKFIDSYNELIRSLKESHKTILDIENDKKAFLEDLRSVLNSNFENLGKTEESFAEPVFILGIKELIKKI